jgi:hypothetical protein
VLSSALSPLLVIFASILAIVGSFLQAPGLQDCESLFLQGGVAARWGLILNLARQTESQTVEQRTIGLDGSIHE